VQKPPPTGFVLSPRSSGDRGVFDDIAAAAGVGDERVTRCHACVESV
jgi:hypothetical protein